MNSFRFQLELRCECFCRWSFFGFILYSSLVLCLFCFALLDRSLNLPTACRLCWCSGPRLQPSTSRCSLRDWMWADRRHTLTIYGRTKVKVMVQVYPGVNFTSNHLMHDPNPLIICSSWTACRAWALFLKSKVASGSRKAPSEIMKHNSWSEIQAVRWKRNHFSDPIFFQAHPWPIFWFAPFCHTSTQTLHLLSRMIKHENAHVSARPEKRALFMSLISLRENWQKLSTQRYLQEWTFSTSNKPASWQQWSFGSSSDHSLGFFFPPQKPLSHFMHNVRESSSAAINAQAAFVVQNNSPFAVFTKNK